MTDNPRCGPTCRCLPRQGQRTFCQLVGIRQNLSEVRLFWTQVLPTISQHEMMSADGFISRSDGIGALSKMTKFGQTDPASLTLFEPESDALIDVVN